MEWFNKLGTNKLVQSTLEGSSESALTSALENANSVAKTATGKSKEGKKSSK